MIIYPVMALVLFPRFKMSIHSFVVKVTLLTPSPSGNAIVLDFLLA